LPIKKIIKKEALQHQIFSLNVSHIKLIYFAYHGFTMCFDELAMLTYCTHIGTL
jgi:hypothetical protein